jgi:hypothetical protein
MTLLERRAWTMLVTAAVAYLVYVVVVLRRAAGGDLPGTAYAAPMLWSIGVAIAVNIAVEIALSAAPGATRETDVRDQEIGWFGDRVGQAFVVIGAVAAMLLAMAEAQPFWTANVVYVCFVLSAVVGSVAKVVAYRRGLPW